MLVVEHKPETIAIADHVVDLGPGAGTDGGTVCFEGTVEGLRGSDTTTGRHLDDRATAQGRRCARRPARWRSAAPSTHNLRDVDVDIPLGVLVRRSPASPGSGKSSLVHGSVAGRDGVVVGRPGRDQGLAAQQPRDVHRAARADPQGVRQGQRREAGAVQLELRGRLPHLQRRRRHLHRARRDGDRRVALRGVRGHGASRRRCWSTPSAARTSPRCSRCRSAEAEAFFADGDAKVAGRPQDPGPARRRRARLPQPRPAAHHAVRRRAAAAQAGHPDGREGRRLRPRRADHRPAPRRRRAAARPAGPARRLRASR